MTDRDRLIELLGLCLPINVRNANGTYDTIGERTLSYYDRETLADYLLANGVIVPPCKVGDTVYYIFYGMVYKGKCHAITLKPTMQIHLYDYDGDNTSMSTETVFLSREEAEQALKEREGV